MTMINDAKEVTQTPTIVVAAGAPSPAPSGGYGGAPALLVSPFSMPSLIDGRCPCVGCVNDRRREDEQRDLAILQEVFA